MPSRATQTEIKKPRASTHASKSVKKQEHSKLRKSSCCPKQKSSSKLSKKRENPVKKVLKQAIKKPLKKVRFNKENQSLKRLAKVKCEPSSLSLQLIRQTDFIFQETKQKVQKACQLYDDARQKMSIQEIDLRIKDHEQIYELEKLKQQIETQKKEEAFRQKIQVLEVSLQVEVLERKKEKDQLKDRIWALTWELDELRELREKEVRRLAQKRPRRDQSSDQV